VLKQLFFFCFVRPLVFIFLGVNARNRKGLPEQGPALVVANHNSHLDTLVLMSLFPIRQLLKVRPVAAADYWLSNPFIAWFANHILRIVPVERRREHRESDPLERISEALAAGDILIFFPEGSRGEAEKLSRFRSGVARLAQRHPSVPIIPVFLHGLGKSLPRGEGLLVPFICDVFVGESLKGEQNQTSFLNDLEQRVEELAALAHPPKWS
jgi:1-acyl-sn-glycerol-3-phosphate acyltransferase